MLSDFETLARLMDCFRAAPDAQARWELAKSIVQDAGLNAVNVGSARSDTLELTFMRSAMRESWLTEYVDEAYFTVDRFVEMARDGQGADLFFSGRVKPDNSKERSLFGRLEDEGYRMGFGQPFDSDRPGERRVVTLFSDDANARNWGPERLAELRCLALVFNAHLFDGAGRQGDGLIAPRLLSGRERDVLLLLASGLQNKQIADRLGLAEVTVRMHFSSARQKLGARTREQALAIAMREHHIAF